MEGGREWTVWGGRAYEEWHGTLRSGMRALTMTRGWGEMGRRVEAREARAEEERARERMRGRRGIERRRFEALHPQPSDDEVRVLREMAAARGERAQMRWRGPLDTIEVRALRRVIDALPWAQEGSEEDDEETRKRAAHARRVAREATDEMSRTTGDALLSLGETRDLRVACERWQMATLQRRMEQIEVVDDKPEEFEV